MNMQVRVAALKEQFEQLFPGKWSINNGASRNLLTGLTEIDSGISRGIAKKRITEWTGPVSSGKTSLLRSAINHWCSSGLNVAYVDTEGKLQAADWASLGNGKGKFWMVRPSEGEQDKGNIVPLLSAKNLYMQEAIWSADQFIRSNAFDIVILDLGTANLEKRKPQGIGYCPTRNQIYARLQRGLDKSKAALIIVSDTTWSPEQQDQINPAMPNNHTSNWGCHTRFLFDRATAIRSKEGFKQGLNGIAMIIPAIRFQTWRDGRKQEVEVSLNVSVPNRLFTHPQVSDRRTSKA